MSKYSNVSDENQQLFDKVLNETSIPKWLEFTVLSDSKLKELYKVGKQNDLVEFLTDGINIAIIINEEIFDGLTDEFKTLALEEMLAGVAVSDTDKISVEKPDFCTYTGILNKFGDKQVISFKESTKSLLDAKKEKEDQAKAEKANNKGKRGKRIINED